jgi:hypothetical protein
VSEHCTTISWTTQTTHKKEACRCSEEGTNAPQVKLVCELGVGSRVVITDIFRQK